MQTEASFSEIIAHAKAYGFVFPSSDIYEGLRAVYDFGPCGVLLKNNIKDLWWRAMTQAHDNIVGLDSAIFMHPQVWHASGHATHFSDPLIDNKDSKKRYRVDHLIEDHAEQLRQSGACAHARQLLESLETALAHQDFKAIETLISEEKIVCPVAKTAHWSPIRQFNLMFATQLGSVAEEAAEIYLRPETAQGIFVNFLAIQKSARMKIPFGVAQIGKAFRNEIVARQFIFRMREFEQMEMQFFITPDTQKEWFAYWREQRLKWYQDLGVPASLLSVKNHQQLAHYADAAIDIEYPFPFGAKEVEGIHSRTDFDLSNHQQWSKKKLTYFDTAANRHYIPYVIETSVGVERLFLLFLCMAYAKEQTPEGEERTVLRLPHRLAPYKAAVLPLAKKEALVDLGTALAKDCRTLFHTQFDLKDSIGKRYRRQDAIGTPYCITIDYESREDHNATVRERDTMRQERMPLERIPEWIAAQLKRG